MSDRKLVVLSQLAGPGLENVPKKWIFANRLPYEIRIFTRASDTDTQLIFRDSIKENTVKEFEPSKFREGSQILAYIPIDKNINELAFPPARLDGARPHVIFGGIEFTEINDVSVRGHEHTVLPSIKITNDFCLPISVYQNGKFVGLLGRNQPNRSDSSIILRGDSGIPLGTRYDFVDNKTKRSIGAVAISSSAMRTINVGRIMSKESIKN